MKKIFNSTILILLSFIIVSCDLDLAPENVMVDETTYKDEKTSEAALLGAYTRMNAAFSGAPTGVNNYANTGLMLLFGELGTPTLAQRVNSSYVSMDNSQYNSSDHDGYILTIWKTLYNAIDYANNIITNIQKYGDYNRAAMERHVAEAKFLRAYEYMLLLQTFGDGALTGDMNGLGAILRLTPYDGYNPDQIESRATVGDTYGQILKDLNEALPYLSDENATTLAARTRATKSAAFALLSRVHLYRGSYTNDVNDIQLAANYADSVLSASKGFTFSTSYTHHTSWMFPLNPTGEETNSANYSDEVLLMAPCYSSVSRYSNGLGYSFYNKGNFYVDQQFVQLYPSGDRRGYIDPSQNTACLIWQGSQTNNPSDLTSFKYNNGSGYNNVLYIRLSEVKLTRAEALARINGINDESIKHLNDINKKAFATKPADYTQASFASAQELIDRILLERMKELAYEGHTRFDLIRSGKKLRDVSVPVERMMLPVPDYDVRISYGTIIQNKGYR